MGGEAKDDDRFLKARRLNDDYWFTSFKNAHNIETMKCIICIYYYIILLLKRVRYYKLSVSLDDYSAQNIHSKDDNYLGMPRALR